ncbi:signal peptidase I [Butyrivibrio sp. INlla16]|uniref:signal peptidase I n=1 Tax=Butyrivibrio sp. INlla16 TaxID=1520807 RepID=UPI000880A360|nr:signal peptidase I [Butyrivibrio sp. INlla16]SDB48808.1 signal peptidase I [Butyrivibrio sp. INlla16]
MLRKNRYRPMYLEKKKKVTPEIFKEILSWVFYTAVAFFVAFVLVLCFGKRVRVIGDSMEPSLTNGQSVLVNGIVYKLTSPKKDDVIVFLPNGNEKSHYYVKRVVAVPGETVKIEGGNLLVNGETVVTEDREYDKMEEAGIAENDITLGSGEFFVLGDNRNSSEDSRSANIGVVKLSTIAGKAWLSYGSKEGKTGFVD